MQINRLFEIVYFLMSHKNATAKNLAEHFQVSSRTIMRDIQTLTTAGIPIYTLQGKGGGIGILDNYKLSKAIVSEEDQNQILFALQSLSAVKHIETKSILDKLYALFEKQESSWIEVDFSRWENSEKDKEKFELLKNALIQKNALEIEYSSSYCDKSTRKIYPLKLIFKSLSWYLQAYCLQKNDYRVFKITRMHNVKILSESFKNKNLTTPKLKEKEYNSLQFIDLKLKFSPVMAYRLYDDFTDDVVSVCDDGSVLVSVTMPYDGWLIGYILSFGENVEVLSPKILREDIIKSIEKIKLKYL